MKICFSCLLEKYKPKGNVLQFLTMLHALDHKIDQLPARERKRIQFDCVLPFEWKNGTDNFRFRHIQFYKATNLNARIRSLDKKRGYDFIFIRGREQAIDLLKKSKRFARKLLILNINYNLNHPRIMKDVYFLWKNSRIMFFQSGPMADRFARYLQNRNESAPLIARTVKVLPQYVVKLASKEFVKIRRSHPLHIVQAGVIRPRYGLPVAVRAIQLIRQEYPEARLQLLYPSVVSEYRKLTKTLLKSPGVIGHGQKSMMETKKIILKAGIGLALIYDNTPDLTPSHAYLSRVLEYASLGIPVITTKTVANVDLFKDDYPLFVEDEQDILRCYQQLMNRDFYEKMSRFVYEVGQKFVAENAVEALWATLREELRVGSNER